MKRGKMKNKKAAFEMSITTLIIIVISVVMLILGLVLVRQIFTGVTESVTVMNAQVREKINRLFEEEGRTVTFLSKTINIKPGTQSFSIPVGISHPEGKPVTGLYFKVTVEEMRDGCGVGTVESWILSPAVGSCTNSYSTAEVNQGYVDILVSIPKGTPYCSQILKVSAYKDSGCRNFVATDSAIVNIVRGGLF